MFIKFLNQKVNSLLCVGLLAAMVLWVYVYYVVHERAIVEGMTSDIQSSQAQ